MNTPKSCSFAAWKSRARFSTVLFSLTLAPTSPQETPFSLRTSFCGSMTTSAVSVLLNSIVMLLVTVGDGARHQAFDFGFQFGDPGLEFLDHRGDLPLREPLVDVLRAVHVPRLDREQDRPLHLAGVRRVAELLQQGRVPLDHAGGAPHLHPPAVRVVHQEEERLRVLGQVAQRDVLAVAAEVGEAERVLVDHLQEPGRAAAVLDVRLPVGVRGAQVEHVQVGEELGQVRGDGRLPAARPAPSGRSSAGSPSASGSPSPPG